MTYRYVAAMGTLAVAIAVVSLASEPAAGQAPTVATITPSAGAKTRMPARTPWGDPDLQGVWRSETTTPLERPKEQAGRAFLTDEEVARTDKIEKEEEAKRLAGVDGVEVGRAPLEESPIRGNEYNAFWQDTGRVRKASRRTSLIVDPPDGQLPFTPEAQKLQARARARYGVGPYNSWRDIDTGERCITDGLVGSMWIGNIGNFVEFVQSPGNVVILVETYHHRRIVPLDGRPHTDVRQWLGDSRGRWEGNTLVIDTTQFIDKLQFEWDSIWRRPSERMHLVERLTPVDAETIDYQITVDDPTTFTRPWTAVTPLTKMPKQTRIYEYACHEGNYGVPNTLSGARAQEKAAAEKR